MEALAIALLLGVALVPLVVPLFRPPLLALGTASLPASRLRELEQRKAAIYGAIREAGFDLRTGKVEQSDHDQQVALLKREAVVVVEEIEDIKANPPQGSAEVESAIAAARQGTPAPPRTPKETAPSKGFCTQCGQEVADDDRFCAQCGTGLESDQ